MCQATEQEMGRSATKKGRGREGKEDEADNQGFEVIFVPKGKSVQSGQGFGQTFTAPSRNGLRRKP